MRHLKGILRSGRPICPGIISFVEKGGEKEMEKGRGMNIVATGSFCAYLKEQKKRGDFGGLHLLPKNRYTFCDDEKRKEKAKQTLMKGELVLGYSGHFRRIPIYFIKV